MCLIVLFNTIFDHHNNPFGFCSSVLMGKRNAKVCLPGFKASSRSSKLYRQIATYGQPVVETHPHLMKAGEVIPGIQLEEVQNRRSALFELMKAFCAAKIDKQINHQIVSMTMRQWTIIKRAQVSIGPNAATFFDVRQLYQRLLKST